MVQEGRLHARSFQWHLKENRKFHVARQPPSMVGDHITSLGMVGKCPEGFRTSSRKPWQVLLQLPMSTTLLKQSHNQVFYNNPQYLNLHAWLLGVDSFKKKASLWKGQRELLLTSGHQQGVSSNQSTLFEKWCRQTSLDFSPSVKNISNGFIFLFQDLNKRLSTIDDYRTQRSTWLQRSIGCSPAHRDRPKNSRNLPKWNFSIALKELTKALLEPTKGTDLKDLTLNTPFLVALVSDKRRSKIHTWVANKMSKLGQWEKGNLIPFFRFHSQKQVSKRFPNVCL